MNALKDAIFRDRWTTIIAMLSVVALIGFAIYTDQLNAATVVNYALTSLLGFKAADSKKEGQ